VGYTLSPVRVEVNPLLASLIALVVNTFTAAMGGVSGAFLLLPFQVSCLSCISPAAGCTTFRARRHPEVPDEVEDAVHAGSKAATAQIDRGP
jgi:hypothetical protein